MGEFDPYESDRARAKGLKSQHRSAIGTDLPRAGNTQALHRRQQRYGQVRHDSKDVGGLHAAAR